MKQQSGGAGTLGSEEASLLSDETTTYFEERMRNAIRSRRELIIHEICRRLERVQLTSGAALEQSDGDWTEIESLSRLRSLVGGRFENLKKKWLDAGFPLKEHRGDSALEYQLNEIGWIGLSNWIVKQGFEARLAPEGSGYLFKLKKVD